MPTMHFNISDYEDFLFTIRRASTSEELGLELELDDKSHTIKVLAVGAKGLVQIKNAKLESIPEVQSKVIAKDDYITAVNGIHSDVDLMVEQINEHTDLYFRIATHRPLCNTSIACEGRSPGQTIAAKSSEVSTTIVSDNVEQQLPSTTLQQKLWVGGRFLVRKTYSEGEQFQGYLTLRQGDYVEVAPKTIEPGYKYNKWSEYVYGSLCCNKNDQGWFPTTILTYANMD